MSTLAPHLSNEEIAVKKPLTRSEKKRQSLLQAASELFTNQGFSATSMDQIAKRAGTSKQTAYSYFGNKESLFVASITIVLLERALPESIFDESIPIRQVLMEIAHFLNKIVTESEAPRVARLCAATSETHPDLSELLYTSGAERFKTELSAMLRQRSDHGELNIKNTDIAAEQFMYMLQAEEAYRIQLSLPPGRTTKDQVKYLESCVDVFMTAYAPK